MLIDDCNEVTAKRQAFDTDLELSQTTRQVEALRIQAPEGCYHTQNSEQSASGTAVFEGVTAKSPGNFDKRQDVTRRCCITGRSAQEQQCQSGQLMFVHLAAYMQPPCSLSSVSQESRCFAIVHHRFICRYQVLRTFLSWLLMSPDAPRIPTRKFKFKSWAQMMHVQAIIAEILGFDKLQSRQHNAKLRKKSRSIVMRWQKCRQPVPMVRRPEALKSRTIPDQRMGVLVGLLLRRPQLHRLPEIYLFQARRTLLLNQNITLRRRECIRLSTSSEYCELLADRPRWMQTPSESTWPGKCRVRAGAEPAGYHGRTWSKKELFEGKKKSSASELLPSNILKRRLKRRVTCYLLNARNQRGEK